MRRAQFALKCVGILCLIAITILSTVPGHDRPHTGFLGSIEHFIAYAGSSFILLIGYGRLHLVRILSGLVFAAGLFETLQIWIPGRGAGVGDWIVSSAGALAGLVAAYLIIRHLSLFSRHEAI